MTTGLSSPKHLEALILARLMAWWLPYPKTVVIEPINVCQLRCPLCPTGARKLNYDSSVMSLETFDRILSKVPFVKAIDLHRAGEPFLNPDIFEMIRRATDKNIYVVLSTNFSFRRPAEFFEALVTCGLDRLIVSMDGASAQTYSEYRVGGDFDLVFSNLKETVSAKERVRSKNPEIVWQFLVNRFNEHEIPTAQQMARDLRISLDLRPLDMSDNLVDVELDTTIEERKAHWLGRNQDYICRQYKEEVRYPILEGICTEIFTSLAIAVDGRVLPCCGAWDKNSVFGNLLTDSFEDIWFGDKYVSSRLRFFAE